MLQAKTLHRTTLQQRSALIINKVEFIITPSMRWWRRPAVWCEALGLRTPPPDGSGRYDREGVNLKTALNHSRSMQSLLLAIAATALRIAKTRQ